MAKIYWLVLLGIISWCLLIFLPGTYFIFSLVCHQLPERTLFNLPVCARCLGIYFGALLGTILYLPRKKQATKVMLALAILLMLLDWVVFDSNLLRLLSGGLLGIVTALLIVPAFLSIFEK